MKKYIVTIRSRIRPDSLFAIKAHNDKDLIKIIGHECSKDGKIHENLLGFEFCIAKFTKKGHLLRGSWIGANKIERFL